MKLILNLLCLIFLSQTLSYGQEQAASYKIKTIAFYNLENLFDTINDPTKFDDDRTPEGKDKYTSKVYWDKIDKLSKVLSEIGREETKSSPVLIGVCEIENKSVLEDLVASDHLKNQYYGFVHYDAPDERGIDVALLYQKRAFKPLTEKAFPLLIYKPNGKRDYTRDVLLVSGSFEDELIHVLVNHWPSRSGGEARTRPFRMAAAALNKKIIDSLQGLQPNAKIIAMGDLNDDPDSPSLLKILKTQEKKVNVGAETDLYNPMASMHNRGLNTLAYRDNLNLFDQIIISQPFLRRDQKGYQFYKAGIYNKGYLTSRKGSFKGYPFRSYYNNTYQGGYSDHFPVYIYLIKKK